MAKIDVRQGRWFQQSATEVSDDVWAMDTVAINPDGNPVSVQHPLPTDGDSVYYKDIWPEESTSTNWIDVDSVGEEVVYIPFDGLHTRIENTTSDNPKILIVHFRRTINAHQVGIGSYDGGDFSNVKLELLGSSHAARTVFDDSANNTKYNSKNYPFEPELFNAVKFSFYTADPVRLSNITIQKSINVSAQLQGLRADNTIGTVNVTNGNNLKISIEELESGISVNNKTQLRTTLFDSGGVEAHVDNVSGTLQTIDFVHHEIHEGNHYFVANWIELDATNTFEFVYQTPSSTTRSHSIVSIMSTGQVEVDAFEDTIAGVDGTQVIPFNSERDSTNTSEAIIRTDPTITSDGNFLWSMSLGSGTNPANTAGAGVSRDNELVLKTNTKYLVRFTSNTNGNRINYRFDWYEHVDSN